MQNIFCFLKKLKFSLSTCGKASDSCYLITKRTAFPWGIPLQQSSAHRIPGESRQSLACQGLISGSHQQVDVGLINLWWWQLGVCAAEGFEGATGRLGNANGPWNVMMAVGAPLPLHCSQMSCSATTFNDLFTWVGIVPAAALFSCCN